MARKRTKIEVATLDAANNEATRFPIAPETVIMTTDTETDTAMSDAFTADMLAEIEATTPAPIVEETVGMMARAMTGADEPLNCDHLIDQSMETAASAGIVDHGSQTGSWVQPDAANEMLPATEVLEPAASEFDQLAQSFDDDAVTVAVFAIAKQVDDRVAFEKAKAPDNANIQRTLEKVRKQLVTKRAARVMLACSVDVSFINRSVHDGSKYNVYALGKLADVVFGVSDGIIANAINLACMRSLFACSTHDVPFTQEVARAAASDKVHIDPAVRKHLIRHTVSASTAPTQASSTMQALTTLGVVKTSGSVRSPLYTLTDAPISDKLREKLAA